MKMIQPLILKKEVKIPKLPIGSKTILKQSTNLGLKAA